MKEKYNIYFWVGWVICYPIRLIALIIGGLFVCASPTAWEDIT